MTTSRDDLERLSENDLILALRASEDPIMRNRIWERILEVAESSMPAEILIQTKET
jgi:hypothetical protein